MRHGRRGLFLTSTRHDNRELCILKMLCHSGQELLFLHQARTQRPSRSLKLLRKPKSTRRRSHVCNGEVTVTFKSISAKEKFLRLNLLQVDAEHFSLQDVDKPLSFLTIYDAPFELSDLAIIKRLSPYCEVLHYRWGKHSLAPNIYNGLRHYRVRISKPIPSFLRFGKFQIFVKHNSQVPTCRKCNCPGHFSNVCPNRVCFNCEGLGHEAHDCPCPVLCCICKKEGHMGINCTYSWF